MATATPISERKTTLLGGGKTTRIWNLVFKSTSRQVRIVMAPPHCPDVVRVPAGIQRANHSRFRFIASSWSFGSRMPCGWRG